MQLWFFVTKQSQLHAWYKQYQQMYRKRVNEEKAAFKAFKQGKRANITGESAKKANYQKQSLREYVTSFARLLT